ncbi:MAG: hypothetical protein Q4G25_16675, partial [Paracoccus sp. (in: a-proteobacteria)]|nr:hypothetical protein [Paracoccus sp. (in: a-proteobacteria)]
HDTVVQDNQTTRVVSGNRSIDVDTGDETKNISSGALTETVALARRSTANSIHETAVGGADGPGDITNTANDDITIIAGKNIFQQATADNVETRAGTDIKEDADGEITMHAKGRIFGHAETNIELKGDEKVDVQSETILLTGTDKIELKVGSSSIVLTTGGIQLVHGGTSVTLDASELVQIAGQIHLNR